MSSVSYVLANNVNRYEGTIDVSASLAISFVIGGVAAGGGYAITMTLMSDDGHATCSGSYGTGISTAGQDNGAPFAVVNRQSTFVTVQMICTDPAAGNQGSVLVNGTANCCPTWDTAVADPSGPLCNAPPGNTSALTGHASSPCDGDGGGGSDGGSGNTLGCVWSVKTGTGVAGPTTEDDRGDFVATFTCSSSPEQDIVQLDCTDGPLPAGGFCPAYLTHAEVSITCNCPPP